MSFPPVRLRQMPAELLRFPVQALKVKVAGLKPPSAGPQDCMLPYSLKWSVKAAMEMVDLLHGSIRASIVVRGNPELSGFSAVGWIVLEIHLIGENM